MAGKKSSKKESPEAQAARFRAAVEEMIAAGELSPTEADKALDQLIEGQLKAPGPAKKGAGR